MTDVKGIKVWIVEIQDHNYDRELGVSAVCSSQELANELAERYQADPRCSAYVPDTPFEIITELSSDWTPPVEREVWYVVYAEHNPKEDGIIYVSSELDYLAPDEDMFVVSKLPYKTHGSWAQGTNKQKCVDFVTQWCNINGLKYTINENDE